MIRTRKIQQRIAGYTNTYYVTFDDRTQRIIRVEIGGDLMDVTNLLSDYDKRKMLEKVTRP